MQADRPRASATAEATAREEAALGDSDFAWCVSEADHLRADLAALRAVKLADRKGHIHDDNGCGCVRALRELAWRTT